MSSTRAVLPLVFAIVLANGCRHTPSRQPTTAAAGVQYIMEPRDSTWAAPVPGPELPPPPTDVGLRHPDRLHPSPPLEFDGVEALRAADLVTGSGTEAAPWTIRNLAINGITDVPGLLIKNVTEPLVIENVRVTGEPLAAWEPARPWGIELRDCANAVIRHCEVSHCQGVLAYGREQHHIRFERNRVFSCDRCLMSNGGHHISAVGNYTRDALMYGIFLYNGTDNLIADNYTLWTGREGVGSHGNCERLVVRNNVIAHNGWTAINCEGVAHDSIIENNLIMDTHYGIVLMGDRTVCRGNRIFYGSQSGVHVFAFPPKTTHEALVVEDNLVVGCGEAGIDLMPGGKGHLIRGNRLRANAIAIRVTTPGTTVANNDIQRFMYGIKLEGAATGCRVVDNHVYSGRNGIVQTDVRELPVNEFAGNRVHHTIYGFSVKHAPGLLLHDNEVRAVGMLLDARECRDLEIRDNRFVRGAYNGLALRDSEQCRVIGNEILGGTVSGILLAGGGKHEIRDNTVSDIMARFGGGGIVLDGTAENRLLGNRLERCFYGVLAKGTATRGNTFEANVFTANDSRLELSKADAETLHAQNQFGAAAEGP